MLLLLLLATACEPAPAPTGWSADELALMAQMVRQTEPRPDPTNRWADDPRAAELGRALFYDAGLSPSGEVSCATCHQPALHFTDAKRLSEGVGTAGRHAPTIEGAQWGSWFFWDGRVDSLWAQALGPIESPVEMGGDRVFLVRAVLDRYAEPYAQVFGALPTFEALPARARPDPPDPDGALGAAWLAMSEADREAVDSVFVNAGKAIAAFERRLIPGESAFDRYVLAVLDGDPTGGGQLSEDARSGLAIFLREGRCVACHHGPMLTDRAFHNLGIPELQGYDPGRGVGARLVKASPFNCESRFSDTEDCPELRYLDPNFDDFRSAFKTPTLRGVATTAPYMHNGVFATLDEVLDFYSELPGVPAVGHRELTLRPLRLSVRQKRELVAFLTALEGAPLPEALTTPP